MARQRRPTRARAVQSDGFAMEGPDSKVLLEVMTFAEGTNPLSPVAKDCVIDRAEADSPEAAYAAGRTLYRDALAAGFRRVRVGYYVDGRLVRLTNPGHW